MARRSSTVMDKSDPVTDNASNPGAGTGVDNSTEVSNTPGAGEVPPPAKRRKRGPNKPKPGTFLVETSARMNHEEIIKLLTAHATTQLGPDVAARMTLQVVDGKDCRTLVDFLPQGITLQFATTLKADA